MNKYIVFCLCLLVFFSGMVLFKNSQAADSLNTKRLSAAQVESFLEQDNPGEIQFLGAESAELFTKEVRESFKGVLQKNYKKNYKEFMPGYITASIDGRPWDDTMWSRDGGTFCVNWYSGGILIMPVY